jgi:hypothetical protein
MRKVVFVFMMILFVGCSTENSDVDTDELGYNKGSNVTMDGISDVDNVSIWVKEFEIVITDFYSQIDTVISERKITRDIKYYCSENETTSVKWSVNGINQTDIQTSKVWIGDLQKWIVSNTANLNIERIRENLQIEAIVQFADKKVRRFKTIPKVTIDNNVSDAFGFTFGTLRTEMNNIIGFDHSPQFSFVEVNFISYNQPFQLFEFSSGKLIKLYAYQSLAENNDIQQLSKRCKIPEQIQFKQGTYHILNPQEWIVGNLKIKVYNTSLENILGHPNNNEIACLTIEKINK